MTNTKQKPAKLAKRGKGKIKQKMTKEERRIKYTNLARERRQKQLSKKKHVNTICFRCRQKGHSVNDCPTLKAEGNVSSGLDCGGGGDVGTCIIVVESKGTTSSSLSLSLSSFTNSKVKCYKCGSGTHSLKQCPKLSSDEQETVRRGRKLNYTAMELPYATCFICNKLGHLSSQCELNKNGIYVNGSSNGCKYCGGNDHLFIHCPKQQNQKRQQNDDNGNDAVNVDAFLEEEGDSGRGTGNGSSRNKSTNNLLKQDKTKKRKKRVVKF